MTLWPVYIDVHVSAGGNEILNRDTVLGEIDRALGILAFPARAVQRVVGRHEMEAAPSLSPSLRSCLLCCVCVGVGKPPAVEYIFVEPYADFGLPFSAYGLSRNPFGQYATARFDDTMLSMVCTGVHDHFVGTAHDRNVCLPAVRPCATRYPTASRS